MSESLGGVIAYGNNGVSVCMSRGRQNYHDQKLIILLFWVCLVLVDCSLMLTKRGMGKGYGTLELVTCKAFVSGGKCTKRDLLE